MKTYRSFILCSIACLFVASVSCLVSQAHAAETTPAFTLQEHIGKAWEHELVTYKLSANQARAISGQALVDGNGKPLAYQFEDASGIVAFQATLEPFKTSSYHFADGKAVSDTDLKITQTDDSIEIANTFTGVRIAKTIQGQTNQTPLLSWRLASGKWVGSTAFTKPVQVKQYTANIVARGPVRVIVACKMTFDNDDTWEMTFQLQANEPAVLIHETFSCETRRSFMFDFAKDFNPAHVISRISSASSIGGKSYKYGYHLSQPLADRTGKLLGLVPWIHWGGYPLSGSHFNLVDDSWNDMFYMATCDEAQWVDPQISRKERASIYANLMRSEAGAITIEYDLAKGQRSYLIGSQSGQAQHKIVEEELIEPGPGQQMQMRHSDYPLDTVKDYVLAWDAPSLGTGGFISPEHIKELMVNYKVSEKALKNARKTKPSVFSLETSLPLYFATHDPELERTLIDSALEQTQETLDLLFELKKQVTVPMAPHHVARFQTTCNLISAIYDSPQMTVSERAKLNAQVAFLAYIFNRDSYCSTARGFTGFPNMTACVYGNRAGSASVLPGHPMRDAWLKRAVADLRREFLDHWVDEDGNYNGSHIESLTYSRLTFDLVLGALYRVYRSGSDPDAIFHPAIKQFGLWHANTSTPRDERLLGWRHDPPVGNNYNFDLSPGLYAMLAFMWKDRDPEFAGQMKWMEMQQGNSVYQAIGGFTPSFAGYRKLFMANNIKPIVPTFGSRVWNETSVILRSHYNDDLENMLYMIAGTGHSHYDQDSGSVTLFGKGEIIADDFGYYGYAPPEDHNMIDSPMASGAYLMHVDNFIGDDTVDYVRGIKKLWTRRVEHIKHPDPKGPNYFVIHDGLKTDGPATWRMWFTAKDVELHENMAIARGLYKVDSDVYFASLPGDAKLTKDTISRSGYGLDYKGKYKRHDTTQTGVIIKSNQFSGMLTLVFPRLKDEQPPVVTSIAKGKGFKIVTPQATDYVFLANKVIEYNEGQLSFKGSAGFVRIAGDDVILRLQEAGDLSYGKHKLHSDAVAPTRSLTGNLIIDGELDTGKWSILPKQKKNSTTIVTLEEGLPPGVTETDEKNNYYQKVVYNGAVGRPIYLTTKSAFVDPQKMYQASISVYLPTKSRLFLSSYAQDSERRQLLKWGWSLTAKGPTDGFKTFKTTLGPEGSGADVIMKPDISALTPLSFRIYDADGTFYIRNITIKPLDDE